MWLIIYFILETVETIGLFVYSLMEESSLQERIWMHFSMERLVLLFFLLCLAGFLLVITVRLIKNHKVRQNWLDKSFKNENFLWLIIIACIVVSITVFYLFIQPQNFFGDYLAVFKNLRPTLFWLLVTSLQTLFFTFLWYAVNFTKKTQGEVPNIEISELVVVLGIFLLGMLVKFLFVLPNGYGMLKDVGETKYLYMLQYFNEGIFLHSATEFTTHYPPLYPLSLMFTFFIRDYAYEAVLVMNACYASSIVFPIYLIARRLFDKKTSLVIIIISSLIPFQFLLPVRLLSENLYFPLLMWALYMIFVAPDKSNHRLVWDCLTGFSLGLLYLTRYISLALIPFLLLAWWLKPFDKCKGVFNIHPRKLLHLVLIVFTAAVTFVPWVITGLDNNLPLTQMLGFGIAADTNPAQLTALNLFKWIAFYGAYFILLAAPVLNLLMMAFRSIKTNMKDEKSRWLLVVLVLVLAFGIAIVRHSWRADYNLELPKRLMGRYVIYFVPLFILSAFLSFKTFSRDQYQNIKSFLLTNLAIPLGLVILSYLLVIKGSILPVNTEFIHPLISIDGYYIQLLGNTFFIIITVLYTGTSLLLWFGRKGLMSFTAAGLVIFYLAAEPVYLKLMAAKQMPQQIGKQAFDLMIAENHKAGEPLAYSVFLPESLTRDEMDDAAWTIFIRNPQSEWQMSSYSPEKITNLQNRIGIVVLPAAEAAMMLDEPYQLIEINAEIYAFKLVQP